jgi:cell division septum initiation protein DivIVA
MNSWSIIMKNLISRSTAHINSLINGLQVKRFLAVVLVGFILLTTNVDSKQNNKELTKQVREQAEQIDSVRPKTTREWYKEARETEDSPGERLQNIAEESAQAVKEFGSLYPDTAKRTAPVLQDD